LLSLPIPERRETLREMATLMEASTITYSSGSDSILEAGKDFVIKLLVDDNGTLRQSMLT